MDALVSIIEDGVMVKSSMMSEMCSAWCWMMAISSCMAHSTDECLLHFRGMSRGINSPTQHARSKESSDDALSSRTEAANRWRD